MKYSAEKECNFKLSHNDALELGKNICTGESQNMFAILYQFAQLIVGTASQRDWTMDPLLASLAPTTE